MTSSLAKSKQIIGAHFQTLFSQFCYFLMFLNIQIDLIILKTCYQLFTLTTKKSLHIIFKPIWILMKQETMEWQWRQLNHVQILAPHSSQITTLIAHHSIFSGQMPILTLNQQCQTT